MPGEIGEPVHQMPVTSGPPGNAIHAYPAFLHAFHVKMHAYKFPENKQ
jgi:hypothetical protein